MQGGWVGLYVRRAPRFFPVHARVPSLGDALLQVGCQQIHEGLCVMISRRNLRFIHAPRAPPFPPFPFPPPPLSPPQTLRQNLLQQRVRNRELAEHLTLLSTQLSPQQVRELLHEA